MKRSYETSMGGGKSRFQTTDWDEIRNARTLHEDRQKEIIGHLIKEYWKPVYCYLIRKGYDNEQAKDLTQDFFHEIVLRKRLIQQADKTKGRFRTFLLTALRNYAIDRNRVEHHPQLISLEDFGEALPSQEMEPDEAFSHAWISLLLDRIIAEVEQGCSRDSQEIHWNLFYARVLKPIMDGTEPPPLPKLCRRLGIENRKNKASNMIVTVKRRFHRVLEDCLRQYVESDSDIEDELNGLLRILTKGCAR
jgi:RNA polymerase sigma-70 factor (ECF subfamily)